MRDLSNDQTKCVFPCEDHTAIVTIIARFEIFNNLAFILLITTMLHQIHINPAFVNANCKIFIALRIALASSNVFCKVFCVHSFDNESYRLFQFRSSLRIDHTWGTQSLDFNFRDIEIRTRSHREYDLH